MKIEIDVEQFAKDIKAGKSIGGADGALAAEIDAHLVTGMENKTIRGSLSLPVFRRDSLQSKRRRRI